MLRFDRRQMLKGLSATAGALAMPAVVTGRAFAQETMAIAVPTGYEDALKAAVLDDFTVESGISVVTQPLSTGAVAQFQAQVDTKTYQYHLAFSLGEQANLQCQDNDLLEPIGVDTPAVAAIADDMKSEYFLGHGVLVHGLAYLEDSFTTPPTSFAAIWDTEGFPGRRSLRMNVRDAIETALRADGVAPEDVYNVLSTEEGWQRAYAKLDAIKPEIAVWWDDDPQIEHAFGTGEVDIGTWFHHRVVNFRKVTGVPLAFDFNQAFYSRMGWAIPKGTPMLEPARQLIAMATEPERIAKFTEGFPMAPVQPQVFEHLDPEFAQSLPTHPDNLSKIFPVDFNFWSTDSTTKSERFRVWLLG
jgi:Spermidine/putrescine-binding periplasmic protein